MDIAAHALRLFDLTEDSFVIGALGSRRFDRDGLAAVCLSCENLQWGI
jgi:hypothetical protein